MVHGKKSDFVYNARVFHIKDDTQDTALVAIFEEESYSPTTPALFFSSDVKDLDKGGEEMIKLSRSKLKMAWGLVNRPGKIFQVYLDKALSSDDLTERTKADGTVVQRYNPLQYLAEGMELPD